MATQTRTIGVLVDDTDGSLATLGYDYDDGTLLISRITIANNTNFSVFASRHRHGQRARLQRDRAPHIDRRPCRWAATRRNVSNWSRRPAASSTACRVVWGWAP
jgi:hypothetical protein